PQISEVAKITEQDMAKADKALSRQPAPLQETLPDSDPEPLKSPEAKTALVPEAPLIQEESPVSPKILDSEKTALSQPSATEQAATPGIDLDAEENENSFSSQPPLNGPESAPEAELETLANENPALPQRLSTEPATEPGIAAEAFEYQEPETQQNSESKATENEEASVHQLVPEDTGSLEAIAIAYWQYILGALVILIATFLLFRKKQKPFDTPVSNLSASENQQEYINQFSTRQTDEFTPSEMTSSVDTRNDIPAALHEDNFYDSRFASQGKISLEPESKSLFTDDEKKDWFSRSEDSGTEALPTEVSVVNDAIDYSTPAENEPSTYAESREGEKSAIDSQTLEDEPTPAEDSIIENERWSYKSASLQNENDEDQEDTTSQSADDKEDVPQDAANNSRKGLSEDNEPKDYVTRRIEAWAMDSKTGQPDTGAEMPADHVPSTTENEDSEDLLSQQDKSPSYDEIRAGMFSETVEPDSATAETKDNDFDESPTYEEIRAGMFSETETIDSKDKDFEDTIPRAEESPSYEDLRAGMTAQAENVDSNAEDFEDPDFQEDESPSYEELRAGMVFQTQNTEAEENPEITDSHEADSLVDHEALSHRGPDDEMTSTHETQETTAENSLDENAESAEAQETPVSDITDSNTDEEILDRLTAQLEDEDVNPYSELMESPTEDPVEEESIRSSEEETKESFAETGVFAYKTFRITEDPNDDATEETLADFTDVSEIEPEDSDALALSDDETKDETEAINAELTEDFTEDEAEEDQPEQIADGLGEDVIEGEYSDCITDEEDEAAASPSAFAEDEDDAQDIWSSQTANEEMPEATAELTEDFTEDEAEEDQPEQIADGLGEDVIEGEYSDCITDEEDEAAASPSAFAEDEDDAQDIWSSQTASEEMPEATAELTEDFTLDEAEESLPENTASNLVSESADDEFSEIVPSEDWENTAPQFTDDATANNDERILTESSEESSPENEMEYSASHSPSEDEILERIASEEMGWTEEHSDSMDSRTISDEATASEASFSEEQSADEENRNLSFQTEDDASPDLHVRDSIVSQEGEGPYDLDTESDLEEEPISSEEPSLTGIEDLLEDASEYTDPPLTGNDSLHAPPSAWPENPQADSPEDVSLETILQILRGFADINKRLHKIAETRYAKNSSEDEKDPQKD
ncbi:MAG: hypothetical protein OEZ51_06000, partial [Nitrospinota bacterium]|nr:hypothetical protein [Nitrospinota bacterium]